ncbi:MAG: hypothetical protein ACU85E_12025 [Gammaproteobacteria bacterium]
METKDTAKILIQESEHLIPPGKSKRLAAMRQRAQNPAMPSKDEFNATEVVASSSSMSVDAVSALSVARARILQQIEQIKMRYPPGKQNKLFALRYGEAEQIKRMSIKEIFALFEIADDIKNFNLIQHLDYHGDETNGGKATAQKIWKKNR